jgi:hypothetical protein
VRSHVVLGTPVLIEIRVQDATPNCQAEPRCLGPVKTAWGATAVQTFIRLLARQERV